MHYNTGFTLRTACDASPYGVGAVNFHIMKNGEESAVAFVSRTITETERKYAQVEKETLAIFGVKNFHKYLYGKTFTHHQSQASVGHTGAKICSSNFGSITDATLGCHPRGKQL